MHRVLAAAWVAAVTVGAAACGSGSRAVLTEQVEARRLAAEMRVQFTKAVEASHRAVMADTDEVSAAAARESTQAAQAVQRDLDTLTPLLQALGYRDEVHQLDMFKARFAEYRALDADILPLAVENTNLKAQRLSFGPSQEAADAFRQALGAAVGTSAQKTPGGAAAEAVAAKATGAVLEIQVVQARHIAESDDAAMSRMEAEMAASEAAARTALQMMKGQLPPAAAPHLAAAASALDRFHAVNTELVALSRRNSNVRSLALSLGRKRTVTAECDDLLQALQAALATHDFNATR